MLIPSPWSRHPRGKLQPGSRARQAVSRPVRWSQKNQGIFRVGRIDESGGERDGADPGAELEKEAEQGGTGRDVGAAGRSGRREGEQFKKPGLAHRIPTAEIVPSR
jgi:hypothetical protein